MAGGMDLGTGGRGRGRRSLDAPINLVPFIDLMAVMISFLIMTAVWTQAGRLEVTNAAADNAPVTAEPPPPSLTVVLTAGGIRLAEGAPFTFADAAERLKAERALHLEAPRVVLRADDDVPYGDVVRLVDTCLGAGLPDVSVEAG